MNLNPVIWKNGPEMESFSEFLLKLWPNRFDVVSSYINPNKRGLNHVLSFTKSTFEKSERPFIVIYGSGDNHHYTSGLVKIAAEKQENDFSYLHIDAHKDTARKNNQNRFDCDSFVQSIQQIPHVRSALAIGCDDGYNLSELTTHKSGFLREILAPYEPLLELKKGKHLLDFVKRVETYLKKESDKVYISSDLDILSEEFMKTYWISGNLNLEVLLDVYSLIFETKIVVGADVLGYNGNEHVPSMISQAIVVGKFIGEEYNFLFKELKRAQNRELDFDRLKREYEF